MAKVKEPRAHDAEAEAVTQIYQVATADAEMKLSAMREEIEALKQESFGMGALHAIEANISYNEFLKAVTLLKIKKEKEYRKGGMTWAQFCEARGLAWHTVDRMLDDFAPVFNSFSSKLADFTGMPFSKIRMLGKQLSSNLAEIKDSCLIYGDETIPLTPEYREDIQALIERIGEDAKEKIEESQAQLSAKDKVLKSKEDVINKQERELKKFEREAAKKGLTVTEDAFIQRMDNLRTTFDGLMLQIEPDYMADLAPDDGGTPRMTAAYLTTLDYARKQLMTAYQRAEEMYGDATMCPEDAWTPPVKG